MKEETVSRLIDYYKWVVNISIFVTTASISLVSAVEGLKFSTMLKWGLAMLLITIFVNWLVIKKLVSYSIIELEKVDTELSKFFLKGLSTLTFYGLFQNTLFIFGLILVVLSFLFGENLAPSVRIRL